MRMTMLLVASALAALAAGCSEAPPQAVPAAPADGLADELRQLEVARPAPAQRRPRPETAAPQAIAPRPVARPLAAEVEVRDGAGRTLARESYRLSPTAVSVTSPDGSEWWLERNPLAPQELHGARVDPAERLVLEHSAGDLRLTGDEHLWDRIALLGFPELPAAGFTASGRTLGAHGLEFVEWLATQDASALRELWWNAEHGLALRCVLRAGSSEVARELVALDLDPDPAALAHPAQRHPDHALSELSDWHDSCGRTTAHRHGPGHEHGLEDPRGEAR